MIPFCFPLTIQGGVMLRVSISPDDLATIHHDRFYHPQAGAVIYAYGPTFEPDQSMIFEIGNSTTPVAPAFRSLGIRVRTVAS